MADRRGASALARAVRAELRARADPERAPAMQAYMKSEMPFLGVGAGERRALFRGLFAEHVLGDRATWRRVVSELWQNARYREERYAAVDLLLERRYRSFLDLDALPLIEEMIVSGAWWDYVDAIAAHAVGHLLREHPAKMKKLLRSWSRDENLWKRRSALLSQLRFKRDIDLELLYAFIDENLDDPDFFIRKAIGWALRQHAWSDPREVEKKVAALGNRLSPLSRREALKNLAPKG